MLSFTPSWSLLFLSFCFLPNLLAFTLPLILCFGYFYFPCLFYFLTPSFFSPSSYLFFLLDFSYSLSLQYYYFGLLLLFVFGSRSFIFFLLTSKILNPFFFSSSLYFLSIFSLFTVVTFSFFYSNLSIC